MLVVARVAGEGAIADAGDRDDERHRELAERERVAVGTLEELADAGAQVEPHRRGEAVARLAVKEAKERPEGEAAHRLGHVVRMPADPPRAEQEQHRAHARAGEEARDEPVLLEQRERAEVRPGDATSAAADEDERLLAHLAVERARAEPSTERGEDPRAPGARMGDGVRDEPRRVRRREAARGGEARRRREQLVAVRREELRDIEIRPVRRPDPGRPREVQRVTERRLVGV